MDIKKYTQTEVVYRIRHALRELPSEKYEHGNESIDLSLSKENYSLIGEKTAAEINKSRLEYEKTIFKYNRKNLIHAIEVVIQCPTDCPEEQKDAFFKESFEHFRDTYITRPEDVFVAQVHKDERFFTPSGEMISKDHLHIIFVPTVPDTKHADFSYRLCADQLTKRSILSKMSPSLQAHLESKKIKATVYRKREDGGKVVGLSVSQLKAFTKATGLHLQHSVTFEELAEIINSKVLEYQKSITVLNENLLQKGNQVAELEQQIDAHQKNIAQLQEIIQQKDVEIQESKALVKSLEEKQRTVEKESGWGTSTSTWGNVQEWGNNSTKTIEIEEEKLW